MIKKEHLFLFIVLIAVLALAYEGSDIDEGKEIGLGEHVILVDIVSDQEEKRIGLSNRSGLSKKEGMKFVFGEEGYHGIWMKDMSFPIDILWIEKDGAIVHIEENVPPESYPEVFFPDKPAKYVLEIKAGLTKESELKIGDKLDIKNENN